MPSQTPFAGSTCKVARCLLALCLVVHPLRPQDLQRDVLAGHVTGPGGNPVVNAIVSVVAVRAAANALPQTARTDIEGRWLIAVQEGPGEYVVKVTAIGMKPSQTTAKRAAAQRPVIVDFRLERTVTTLGQVRVVETRRPKPPREIAVDDRAAVEVNSHAGDGELAVADEGNLAAMAATVAGVMLMPDPNGGPPGFSMLGLPADQNRVTLNGLSFGGGDIPRDAVAGTRVASTSYDVSRGGFSGGQLSVLVFGGGNFYSRTAHLTLDSPSFQATDAVGRQTGLLYTNAQVSGSASGPIVYDRAFYNISFQAGRKSGDLTSLLSGDPFSLQRIGVAQDSVRRLISAMALKGLPLTNGAVPGARQTDNASLLARLDWDPSDTTNANLVLSVRRNRSAASFIGLTAVPGHGGEFNNSGADVTASLSTYVHGSFLNDLHIGAHTNVTASDPYLELPDMRVLVNSVFADSTTGSSSLLFGGNPALPRGAHSSGQELQDQVSWFSLDQKHRVRMMLDARDDAFSQDQYTNQRGSYSYNSIADFEANRPAAFSRVFAAQSAAASAMTGAISIGDEWRPRERIRVLYGARLDANRFGDAPPYNPLVDARFHLRTDFTPSVMDVSPRVGFYWAFGNNGTTGIPGFGSPWGFLRGGVGEFRNDIAPTLIAPALVASGLANSVQQISCVGAAVPLPDWSAFAHDPSSIPSRCADTTGSSPYASHGPNVWLVDPHYAAQRSWRGNLAIGGYLIPKLLVFSVDGIYSTNLRQPSPLDLNFNAQQRFALPSEGNRPVYVNAANIVPATGAMTNSDSRLYADFGSVTALMTDLRSETRQILVDVTPIGSGSLLGRNTLWKFDYLYQSVRDEVRGFGGNTAGDPLAVELGRGALDFRHQISLGLRTRFDSLFSIGATVRFTSGLPYTPMVNGDINGDGLANDRAFVFSPATGDSAVRAGMTSLLASAPQRVRDCLQRQMGHVAGRNSCEGPWTGMLNAVLRVNPETFGFDNRLQLDLSFTNVLAGVDELVHGVSHMQGWGQPAYPDPTLLIVRGFNPTTNAFTYEVNPRFGDTRLASTGFRAPFLMTIEARVLLGRDARHQTVEQVLEPGRTRPGDKLTVQQVRNRLLNSVFNPVRGLLQAKDSLTILTNAQLAQLTSLDRRVTAQQDSIVMPLARYVAALSQSFDKEDVVRRVLVAQNALFDVIVSAMREAGNIFTQEQIDEFPPGLNNAFDISRLLTRRPVAGFMPGY